MGFFSLIGCSKKRDLDELVLVQLRQAGADLSKPHKVEFFLYLSTEAAAQQAALRIQKDGFQTQVSRAAKREDWLCFATKTMQPSLPELQKIRRDFDTLTADMHGVYDGWGTEVEK